MWENFVPKTEDEIKKLAIDLHSGLVFTSAQIPESSMVGMVFYPILLGGLQNASEEDIGKIGIVYEYLDKALPRSCNGMPCFTSCHYLHKDDYTRLIDKFKKVQEAMANL